jgi:hypothetical protein
LDGETVASLFARCFTIGNVEVEVHDIMAIAVGVLEFVATFY